MVRLQYLIENKKCTGCYSCAAICPKSCIEMKNGNDGFLYPHIDITKCIDCKICQNHCPVINPIGAGTKQKKEAFAAISKNAFIRENSSSGGIFTHLAEKIISEGGVVFGARFDDSFSVIHDFAESTEELAEFRGSKYVQSRIGDVYKRVKEFLEIGRYVYFSGTPCQIAGLKAYLVKDYNTLFTQDLICHGVPSPAVWKRYVKYHEIEKDSKTIRTFFRYKKYGWKKYSLLFEYSDNREYTQPLTKDLYLKGFLSNLYLRDSCYHCCFKGKERISDITLADFWGVENIVPEINDDKGTSLVLINTDKGKRLFESVNSSLDVKSVDRNEALKYNTAAFQSATINPKRSQFFTDFQNGDLENKRFLKLMRKYCEDSVYLRAKRIIRSVVSKIKFK